MQNMSASVNAGCIAAHPSDPLACATPQANYAHIQAPYFVLNSMLDAYQMGDILQVGCSSISECNATQIGEMKQYQADFHSNITAIPTFSSVGNGAFVYNCDLHCGEQNADGFNQIAVPLVGGGSESSSTGRTVMQAALTAWWESDGTDPAAAHTYIEPCILQGAKACNPTCPASTVNTLN
jgi:hypothetical protein